jgi:hypothetical protein
MCMEIIIFFVCMWNTEFQNNAFCTYATVGTHAHEHYLFFLLKGIVQSSELETSVTIYNLLRISPFKWYNETIHCRLTYTRERGRL